MFYKQQVKIQTCRRHFEIYSGATFCDIVWWRHFGIFRWRHFGIGDILWCIPLEALKFWTSVIVALSLSLLDMNESDCFRVHLNTFYIVISAPKIEKTIQLLSFNNIHSITNRTKHLLLWIMMNSNNRIDNIMFLWFKWNSDWTNMDILRL